MCETREKTRASTRASESKSSMLANGPSRRDRSLMAKMSFVNFCKFLPYCAREENR